MINYSECFIYYRIDSIEQPSAGVRLAGTDGIDFPTAEGKLIIVNVVSYKEFITRLTRNNCNYVQKYTCDFRHRLPDRKCSFVFIILKQHFKTSF